jgi:uncharacterized protein YggE
VLAIVDQPEAERLGELVRSVVASLPDASGLAVEYVGVGYGVRDCRAVAALAADAALADAQARAENAAHAMNTALGGVLAIIDTPGTATGFAPPYGCGQAASGPSGTGAAGSAPAYDPTAPAAVTAIAHLTVIYAALPANTEGTPVAVGAG